MPYTNIIQNADTGGCSKYRMSFPSWRAQTTHKQMCNIDTLLYLLDEKMYRTVNMIMFRPSMLSDQLQLFEKFYVPLREKCAYWIIYNLDDVIVHKDIPPYNSGRKAYLGEDKYLALKKILNYSDFIVVTTEILRDYYVKEFAIPAEKFLIIPNYMPRWWPGEAYHVGDRMETYHKFKKKPRIGITSSTSHFDVNNLNDGVDDFSHVNDFIRSTVDKYQWVFIGTVPVQLRDLVLDQKIELHQGSDILNYLRELRDKKLNCIVAPLQDNIFNRCKSNIKLIESWSLGIPIVAQNLPLYSKYTDYVFDDVVDLQKQLDRILLNPVKYKKLIQSNREIVDHGDVHAPNGWWLEKNMRTWDRIFTMPKRAISVKLPPLVPEEAESTDTNIIEID